LTAFLRSAARGWRLLLTQEPKTAAGEIQRAGPVAPSTGQDFREERRQCSSKYGWERCGGVPNSRAPPGKQHLAIGI